VRSDRGSRIELRVLEVVSSIVLATATNDDLIETAAAELERINDPCDDAASC